MRFLNQENWISSYRNDDNSGEIPIEDLPLMTLDKCSLPTNYDPRFRLEAADFSNLNILYEGLDNFGMRIVYVHTHSILTPLR